jgi:hypothetical protein
LIYLSKYKILGLLFSIITGTLFSEELPPLKPFHYTVSLSQSAGFLYGAGEEKVYKTEGNLLSRLTCGTPGTDTSGILKTGMEIT